MGADEGLLSPVLVFVCGCAYLFGVDPASQLAYVSSAVVGTVITLSCLIRSFFFSPVLFLVSLHIILPVSSPSVAAAAASVLWLTSL